MALPLVRSIVEDRATTPFVDEVAAEDDAPWLVAEVADHMVQTGVRGFAEADNGSRTERAARPDGSVLEDRFETFNSRESGDHPWKFGIVAGPPGEMNQQVREVWMSRPAEERHSRVIGTSTLFV
jgi:hypothetical protein